MKSPTHTPFFARIRFAIGAIAHDPQARDYAVLCMASLVTVITSVTLGIHLGRRGDWLGLTTFIILIMAGGVWVASAMTKTDME